MAFYDCSRLKSVTVKTDCSFGALDPYNKDELDPDYYKRATFKDVFSGCSSLTSVTIPEGESVIGSSAFKDWSNLTSVTIPKSVRRINSEAFSGCSGLTSVDLEGVAKIGNSAFRNCSGLTSVKFNEDLTHLNRAVFLECDSLKEMWSDVRYPESIWYATENSITYRYPYYVFSDEARKSAILYIPAGSKERYKTIGEWKNFLHIEEFDMTGIKEETSDTSVAVPFSVCGCMVSFKGGKVYYAIYSTNGNLLQRGICHGDTLMQPTGIIILNVNGMAYKYNIK